jgi:broad specificity phosphatase PhoE
MRSEIILLKHSMPDLIGNTPPQEWKLGVEGQRSAMEFADRLRKKEIRHILSSSETKALETAKIIGRAFGIEPKVIPGIHEIDIKPRPILSREEHINANSLIFEMPDRAVLGNESASNARQRFETALQDGLGKVPLDEDVLVVSHGTVISLFVASKNGCDPLPIWKNSPVFLMSA